MREEDFEIKEEITGNLEISEDVESSDSRSSWKRPRYMPGDIIEIEVTENTPDWLVYQVEKMRDNADEVKDFLDIYSRFMDEEWNERPSEIEGFLSAKGYENNQNELEWLVEKAADEAVELCRQRDLVDDVYNGVGFLPGSGKIKDVEPENAEKIGAEMWYASHALELVERAGATTEGGYTEPYPSFGVEPENSLGHIYKNKLEQEAEDVDWILERKAYWE